MKRLAVVSGLAVLAVAACQPPAETAEARLESEAVIRMAIDSLARSFAEHANMGHADVVAGFYAEDAVVMPPNEPVVTGRTAIQEFFSGMMALSPQLTLTSQTVSSSGDMAIERGTYTFTFTPEGATEPVTDTGKYLVHWHRIGGQWLMVEDIWNSDVPLTP